MREVNHQARNNIEIELNHIEFSGCCYAFSMDRSNRGSSTVGRRLDVQDTTVAILSC
jgi:hypothetical protein